MLFNIYVITFLQHLIQLKWYQEGLYDYGIFYLPTVPVGLLIPSYMHLQIEQIGLHT